MVISQLPIINKLAHVLFNFGATYSFISALFADCLGRNKDIIGKNFKTVLPSGDVMLLGYWLRVVPVVIFERKLSVDLVILHTIDYDVILGMDFLSKYEATIDYKAKIVSFKPPSEEMFIFLGDRYSSQKMFVSAMKARKC